MGTTPAQYIERAGKYLLDHLLATGEVRYSAFFDGSAEKHKQLMEAFGLKDEHYSAEHLIDLAVFQLEDQEIVEKQSLSSTLEDGEEDYLITLTRKGRKRLAAGFTPQYGHQVD